MVTSQDFPRTRPLPGQQWEESSAKFHLSDVFPTPSILMITIPHEGWWLLRICAAWRGWRVAWLLGTEGWGSPFLSVLLQTWELPNNYHFFLLATYNDKIVIGRFMWSKFTFLLNLHDYYPLWAHSNQIKAMMPLNNVHFAGWPISGVHPTSVVCVDDLIKRHNAPNWFYIQLFSI